MWQMRRAVRSNSGGDSTLPVWWKADGGDDHRVFVEGQICGFDCR